MGIEEEANEQQPWYKKSASELTKGNAKKAFDKAVESKTNIIEMASKSKKKD